MKHKTWFLFNTSEYKTFTFVSRKLARQYKDEHIEYKLVGPMTLQQLQKRLWFVEQQTLNRVLKNLNA